MRIIIVIIAILFIAGIYKASDKVTPTLTAEELTLDISEKYNININNKIPGSKYRWLSSDETVAIVNINNGKVMAVSDGFAIITCKITTKAGVLSLTCNVTVRNSFFKNNYMAHALGGYENKIYNNTKEALENSLENGYRFMEVDLILTADNKLVCYHGWDEATYVATGIKYAGLVPTYHEFISWKIQDKYDTIDVSTVIEYMKKYPDLHIEVDLKKYNAEKTKIMVKQLVELADYDDALLNRVLMQFASEEAFYYINEVYHFKYYQYFTYKSKVKKKLEQIIEFCKSNDITSIAVNYTVLDDDMIRKIKDNGFYLLAFTIDDIDIAQKFLDKGVDTICTNFVIP